jgi:hypothetical protein
VESCGGDPAGVVRWRSWDHRRADGVAVEAKVESARVDWAVSGVKSGAVPIMGNGETYLESEEFRDTDESGKICKLNGAVYLIRGVEVFVE